MRLFIYEMISAGALGNDAAPSLRGEGWAMLAAIVEDFSKVPGVEVVTVVDDLCPECPKWNCRLVYPLIESDVFCERAAAADYALIIAPEFKNHLATRTELVLEAGCRLLGSVPDAVRLTGDKLRTASWLAERGIPTPPTQEIEVWGPSSLQGPRVCKPRYGAGSQSMCLLQGPYDFPPGDADIEQPYVPGQPASVAFLIAPHQIVPTPGATQRLSDDGRFQYLGGRTPLPKPLRDRAQSLARRAVESVPGLFGYIGVDLILGDAADGTGDVVIEINPRLTTSYIGLRQLAHTNLAEVWWRLACGETVEEIAWSDNIVDFSADGRTALAVSHER
jgi:predicted ATP-grasp superfamily ATP-dependent carboligase